MRFFLIDDSRTSALRDARVKDRLTYAPRSYGVTKKRPLPLPPKRPVIFFFTFILFCRMMILRKI